MNRDTALCLKLSTARQSGIRNGLAAACAQARRWYAVYHQRRALAVKAVLDSELRKLAHSLEGMVKIDHGFGENAPGYNAAESDNDARWRAVDVMVYGSRPADIKSPPLPQPPR